MNPPSHPLRFDRNHLFAELPEGLFLLDTGSPRSFGLTGQATVFGETEPLARIAGTALDAIRKLAGPDCVGLLGLDRLGRRATSWDGVDRVLVADAPRPPGAAVMPLSGRKMLTCEATIAGRPVRVILDSGAQYGYLLDPDPTLVVNGVIEDDIEDFSPILGRLESPSWRLDLELAGVRVSERFGLLRPPAAGYLRMLDFDAIVGFSWLPGRRLWLSPGTGELAIEDAAEAALAG